MGNNFDQESHKVIFIAHSLGGLVAQNALCLSQTSAELHIRDVGNSILAIMFVGTPHLGADIASWARLGTSIASLVTRPARDLVRVLEPGSEMLASIQDRFHSILRSKRDDGQEILITCFYEELPMLGVGEVCYLPPPFPSLFTSPSLFRRM